MSRILSVLMPVLSVAIVAFGLGIFITETKLPPYRTIANGAKTLYYSFKAFTAEPYLGQFSGRETGVAPGDAATSRFTARPGAATYPGTLLVNGGLNEFREHCPEDGCIGVEIDRTGAVLNAWPFRPDAIFAADMTDGSFYREGVPADPRLIFRPLGLQRYGNGDLLVIFQSVDAMFPFAAGAARIDGDGNPVWFRFDYSHHWATLLPDGTALVPDLDIAEGDWVVPLGPRANRVVLECETDRPQVDGVHVLGPDGAVLRRLDVAAALVNSPWSAMLAETTNACDPLHINYVDVLDDTAPGGVLEPGHLVISLRNMSAIAVLDPETGQITAVVRGSFVQQHSVQHLEGSKVLLFDNRGGDRDVGRVSRLMEVDLATGTERRVFPQPGALGADPPLYSDRGSHLAISADRRRALVTFSGEGRGVEIDIATGAVILDWLSLHDLSALDGASDLQKSQATRAALYGMKYVDG